MKKRAARPKRTTIAEDRRRAVSLDTIRDLKASLAHDPNRSTRARTLRELSRMPRKPFHPLDLYLRERHVSRERGAELLGMPLGYLNEVIRDWKRPPDAETIASMLGEDVDALFPVAQPYLH